MQGHYTAIVEASGQLEDAHTAREELSGAIADFLALAAEDPVSRGEVFTGVARKLASARQAIHRIEPLMSRVLSPEEIKALVDLIDRMELSRYNLRDTTGAPIATKMIAADFTHLQLGSERPRQLLRRIEIEAARIATSRQQASFERSQWMMQVLLLMVLAGAIVSVASSGAMFQAAATARRFARAREVSQANLQLNTDRFKAALDNMSQGLCMFDVNRRLTMCNERYATLYGLDPEKLGRGVTVEDILTMRVAAGASPKDAASYVADRLHEAHSNHSYKIVHELIDGRFIQVSHEPLPHGGWVATHEDVTEKRLAESKISHLAMHDALTGLPNRVVLATWLEEKLQAASGEETAILCLDLDLFKRVNDTLGHQYGDMLLCQVAERLRSCTRGTDLVVRLGGDEFAIVQCADEQPQAATALAERVIALLNEPFDLEGHQIVIGTSIGIALAPSDGDEAFKLLKSADLALYQAKADGRNVYRRFKRRMDARMQARRLLEVDLCRALADDELELVYQPILKAAERRIVGFEALLRWNHPTRGRVAPDDFIPLAEEIGLIGAIGEWVVRQACTEATTWPSHIRIAVNLSPVQFRNPNLAASIVGILAETGLNPKRLELEVTEAVLVREAESVTQTLVQFRSLGIRIAMDDFGTGYSSLSYLQKFPFDKIKIDKGFMRKTSTDKEAFTIVKAVIALGKGLGMTITAEGVETEEQFQRLLAEKCDEVQGFLFSPARPATEARRLLASFSGLQSAA